MEERIFIRYPNRAGFIRRTFILFLIQIACLCSVVVYIIKVKDDWFRDWISDYDKQYWMVILHVTSVTVAVYKKTNRRPLPHWVGFPCWIMQTGTLTYITGYLCYYGSNKPKVFLVYLVANGAYALINIFLGGCLTTCNFKNCWMNLASGIIVVIMLYNVII